MPSEQYLKLVRAFPAFQDMAEIDGKRRSSIHFLYDTELTLTFIAIYCFKKALFLIHAIVIRFGSISPPPFPIPATTNCPIFTDNVIPSMLIHLGVIDISASTSLSALFPHAGSPESLKTLLGTYNTSETVSDGVGKEGPVLTPDEAYILRGAAIDACELIVEVARSTVLSNDGSMDWIREITLPELDMWIWSIAKDRADYRTLERFAVKNTVFF